MRKQRPFCLVVLMMLILGLMVTGCAKKTPVIQEAAVSATDSGAMGPAESLDSGASADDNIMEGRTSDPMLPVYFDFDSALINADQVKRLETNADFLKKNPETKIRIEGNCDPRGTRDYNLALGERRALSARKYLLNLGVEESRMSTVSWGAEKLLLYGHDELSWAQNRRDDFVIIIK